MELYIALAFLSALMSALLAFQIYKLDVAKKFRSFLPVMFSTGVWALFTGLWILLPLELSMIAVMLSFVGIITLPVFLFLFALDYSESNWMSWIKKRGRALWILPVVSMLIMFTNRLHGWFWSDIVPDRIYMDYVVYNYIPSTWFWVHSVYSYGLVIAAALIFIMTLRRQRAYLPLYALLVGILLPMAGSILYVSGVTMLDYSPLLLSLTIILFAMAISQRFYLDNISKISSLQEKTSELNRFYHNVVRVSERLIQSEPEKIDKAIEGVLRTLGLATDVDRSYVFLYDPDSDEVSNSHEWCREGIPSEKENLQQIPFSEAVPRWRNVLMNNDHVYIPMVKDLPEDETYVDERAILEPQGIQSVIVVPMHSGKQFAGFVGFDSVRHAREWDDESIALLKLAASIIAGSIDRVGYERELIHAREKAEESNRVKTEFLANMSHELRTPLNAILGFTNLVAEDIPHGENREHLEVAIKSSNALLRLINDLLDFSKAEAGMLTLKPEPIGLLDILDFVKKTFQPGAMEKNLDFQLRVCPLANKTFLLDETRLRQVLFNLVGNAVKFTHEGHIKVIASIRPQDKPSADDAAPGSTGKEQEPADHAMGAEQDLAEQNPAERDPAEQDLAKENPAEDSAVAEMPDGYAPYTVILAVEDTGIGIREEDQKAVFHEFKQLSGGDNRQYDGTGLGLGIARRLVSLMGGEIRLTSKMGEGSRFSVVIPDVPGK